MRRLALIRRLVFTLLLPALVILASCSKKEDHATDAASEEHPTAQLMTADELNRQAAEDAAAAATAPADSIPAPVPVGAPPMPADDHPAPAADAHPPAADAHAPAPAAKAAADHH